MGELVDRMLPRHSIIGRAGYKFYKQNCNKDLRSKNINRDNHPLIVSAIFKKVAEKLLENKSGVFLTKLGYFCILMYPKRMMIRNPFSKTGDNYFNTETDYRTYSPQWLHGMYPSQFSLWTMDRAFAEGVRKSLAEKLRAGKKYVIEYKLIKSLKEFKHNSK